MALFIWKTTLAVLLLVTVAEIADSDLICRIRFSHGYWVESSRTRKSNSTEQCTGYLFDSDDWRQTRFRLPYCIGNPERNHCLLNCNETCQAQRCQSLNPRYNKTRLCLPLNCLESCIDGHCTEKGKCIPTSCIDKCTDGQCDEAGNCICREDLQRDSSKPYSCITIDCPNPLHKDYCQSKCLNSGCSKENGQCTSGVCSCNEGFKPAPKKQYQCIKIDCPSTIPEDVRYCKSQCDIHCTKGTCHSGGTCECDVVHKKAPKTLYECNILHCPASSDEDRAVCRSLCAEFCTNGRCSEGGVCECVEGYVPTHATLKMDCHHNCNADGSCTKLAFVGAVGGGIALFFVVFVAVFGVIWSRKWKVPTVVEQDTADLEMSSVRTKEAVRPGCESYLEPLDFGQGSRNDEEEIPYYEEIGDLQMYNAPDKNHTEVTQSGSLTCL